MLKKFWSLPLYKTHVVFVEGVDIAPENNDWTCSRSAMNNDSTNICFLHPCDIQNMFAMLTLAMVEGK